MISHYWQGVLEFFEKVKERQLRYHPVILDGLSKVLINMGMVDEVICIDDILVS